VAPEDPYPGQVVTVDGTNFQVGVEAFFGETKAVGLVRVGPTSLRCETPSLEPGIYSFSVRNPDGRRSQPLEVEVREVPAFIRGDANRDLRVDVSDAILILLHLFHGEPLSCGDAADVDDGESLALTDAIRTLDFLFRGGPAPVAPFPGAGFDPTGTALSCER
jgi:hypothetical protein